MTTPLSAEEIERWRSRLPDDDHIIDTITVGALRTLCNMALLATRKEPGEIEGVVRDLRKRVAEDEERGRKGHPDPDYGAHNEAHPESLIMCVLDHGTLGEEVFTELCSCGYSIVRIEDIAKAVDLLEAQQAALASERAARDAWRTSYHRECIVSEETRKAYAELKRAVEELEAKARDPEQQRQWGMNRTSGVLLAVEIIKTALTAAKTSRTEEEKDR